MRIGQLAERLDLNPRTIRYYEGRGLLPAPERSASGYRRYGEADADRLVFIRTAQRLGLTLDEIREIIAFRDRGEQPCAYVRQLLRRQVVDLERRLDEMAALRQELRTLVARAEPVAAGDCYCALIEHGRAPASR